MHEYGITESVVTAVTERMPGVPIACVRLEIGSLSGVSADSVRFYFGPASEGTSLEGARLEISEVAARCRCDSCPQEPHRHRADSAVPVRQPRRGHPVRRRHADPVGRAGAGHRLSPPAHPGPGRCARAGLSPAVGPGPV